MEDSRYDRYWAISGIGWARSNDPHTALAQHDEIQKRNLGHMLNVPVEEIPVIVHHAPYGAKGFVLTGTVRWEIEGEDEYVEADPANIVIARAQHPHWHEMMREEGHTQYQTL